MLQLFVSHFVRVPPSSMFGDEMQHTLFRLINVREEHLCCSCQHPMGGYAQLKKQGQSVERKALHVSEAHAVANIGSSISPSQ
mmetsp:Transcript_10255/g.17192  ORF Transcript_10255/g.17192 Transcript_10255/m.17192 type:complete len:83 (+) Transcript_10255:218-466(+)